MLLFLQTMLPSSRKKEPSKGWTPTTRLLYNGLSDDQVRWFKHLLGPEWYCQEELGRVVHHLGQDVVQSQRCQSQVGKHITLIFTELGFFEFEFDFVID